MVAILFRLTISSKDSGGKEKTVSGKMSILRRNRSLHIKCKFNLPSGFKAVPKY